MARLLSVLVLGLLAAPAVAADAGPRVSPRHGGIARTFVVGFTAPEAAGHQGVVERSYDVSVATTQRGSCTSGSESRVDSAAKGQRVHVPLRPDGSTRHWCRGLFKGTISMEEGPFCQQGQPCPEFATRIRTIGHFRFRVR